MKIKHYHFENLPSTNGWAKKYLKSFDRDEITLVTAESQTEGRGQYGRKWISTDHKNINASFCFFIDENQQDPLSITHVLAISAARMLTERGVSAQIKWPNDILVNHKKIAGILCETEYLQPQYGVVIGIGFNINMSQEDLDTIGQPATSFAVETKKEWDVEAVQSELNATFKQNLTHFLEKGFEPFLPAFRKLILPGLGNQHIL